MNIKRRLLNLECRPFRRPLSRRDDIVPASLQRKLALPLPPTKTVAEFEHALALMQAAQKLYLDRGDTGGWTAFREYAIGLHLKAGTVPFWDDEPLVRTNRRPS